MIHKSQHLWILWITNHEEVDSYQIVKLTRATVSIGKVLVRIIIFDGRVTETDWDSKAHLLSKGGTLRWCCKHQSSRDDCLVKILFRIIHLLHRLFGLFVCDVLTWHANRSLPLVWHLLAGGKGGVRSGVGCEVGQEESGQAAKCAQRTNQGSTT